MEGGSTHAAWGGREPAILLQTGIPSGMQHSYGSENQESTSGG